MLPTSKYVGTNLKVRWRILKSAVKIATDSPHVRRRIHAKSAVKIATDSPHVRRRIHAKSVVRIATDSVSACSGFCFA